MTAADRIRAALAEAGALPEGARAVREMFPLPGRARCAWWLLLPGGTGIWLGRTSAEALRRIRSGEVAAARGGGER